VGGGGCIVGGSFVLQRWFGLKLGGNLRLKMRDFAPENATPEVVCRHKVEELNFLANYTVCMLSSNTSTVQGVCNGKTQ